MNLIKKISKALCLSPMEDTVESPLTNQDVIEIAKYNELTRIVQNPKYELWENYAENWFITITKKHMFEVNRPPRNANHLVHKAYESFVNVCKDLVKQKELEKLKNELEELKKL